MPKHYPQFEVKDTQVALAVVESCRHGIITVNGAKHPITADAPLLVKLIDNKPYLEWHFSRLNPIFKRLSKQEATIKVVGPSAHISPTWYHKEHGLKNGRSAVAPTWNYVMAEFYGQPVPLSRDELREFLRSLVNTMEGPVRNGLRFQELKPQYVNRLLPQIGAFRMAAEEFSCRLKLSQDMAPEDRQGILHGLRVRKGLHDRAMAELIRKVDL